jgi:hypothetical protein
MTKLAFDDFLTIISFNYHTGSEVVEIQFVFFAEGHGRVQFGRTKASF